MGYLKSIGTVVIYFGLFLAVITFMPGLPPETEFQKYNIVPPRDLDPKLGPKNLTDIEKLFENKISGPEDFSSYNGQIYTGVHGGYVMKIEEDHLVPVVKFGKHCAGIWQEEICGRPLGMRFDKKGNLYVVDTYYGIFKVDVTTRKYKHIVNISKPIDGKVPKLPNSLDIADNGDFYWTDSSTDIQLKELVLGVLLNPSGRLIHYNAAKQKNKVLMNNLGFANGVVLSDDESYVLVAETMKNRIMKYNLKGPKAGKQEVFIEGLPGMPDNLVSDGHGGIFVTLILTVDSEHPNLAQTLAPHPYLRKMLVRLLMAMRLPFKLLHDIYPNTYTEKVIHAIGSYQGIGKLIFPTYVSSVLRIDASDKIVEAIFVDHGISSIHAYKDYLWFGSPWQSFILRVPLKQAFPSLTSQTRSEKQSTISSNNKSERVKRDTASTKPVESKETSSQTTSKPTAAPTTTSKPTAAPTTTTPPETSPKLTTATPKPSPKADKPTDNENVKTESKSDAKKNDAKKVDNMNAQKSKPEKVEHGKTARPRDDL